MDPKVEGKLLADVKHIHEHIVEIKRSNENTVKEFTAVRKEIKESQDKLGDKVDNKVDKINNSLNVKFYVLLLSLVSAAVGIIGVLIAKL